MSAPHQIRHDAQLDALLSVEMAGEVRAVRMARETFKVWQVLDGGLAQPNETTGDTLAEIEARLACDAHHGRTFLVLSTDTLTSKSTLRSYRIRRGKWLGRYDADAKRIYSHSADLLFAVAVSAFDPVLPWRHAPGCDVLGRGSFIEGNRA